MVPESEKLSFLQCSPRKSELIGAIFRQRFYFSDVHDDRESFVLGMHGTIFYGLRILLTPV